MLVVQGRDRSLEDPISVHFTYLPRKQYSPTGSGHLSSGAGMLTIVVCNIRLTSTPAVSFAQIAVIA
jgi:hypothetical protein